MGVSSSVAAGGPKEEVGESMAAATDKTLPVLLSVWSPAPDELDHYSALRTLLKRHVVAGDASPSPRSPRSISVSAADSRDDTTEVEASRLVEFIESELVRDKTTAENLVGLVCATPTESLNALSLTQALALKKLNVADVFRAFRLAACAQLSRVPPLKTFGQLALTVQPSKPVLLNSILTVKGFGAPGNVVPAPPSQGSREVLLVFRSTLARYKAWYYEEPLPRTFEAAIEKIKVMLLSGSISQEIVASLSTIMLYDPIKEAGRNMASRSDVGPSIAMEAASAVRLGQFVSACNAAFLSSLSFDIDTAGVLTPRLLNLLCIADSEVDSLISARPTEMGKVATILRPPSDSSDSTVEMLKVTPRARKHYDRIFEECNCNPLLNKVSQEAFGLFFAVQLRLPFDVRTLRALAHVLMRDPIHLIFHPLFVCSLCAL